MSCLGSHFNYGLLDIYSDSFPIHTFPCLADEPELEADANLFACFPRELEGHISCHQRDIFPGDTSFTDLGICSCVLLLRRQQSNEVRCSLETG